jgi:uncharacterized membrane protein YfcA
MEINSRPEITRAPVTATVIGLLAGMFSALLGVGGGLLMVPALAFMLRIRPQRAHGTSLAAVLPTAVAGVYQYYGHGNVRWGVALLLAAGAVVGALIGARLLPREKARRFRSAFGITMILVGICMIAVAAGHHDGARAIVPADAPGWTAILLVGVLAGAISGVMGVGGGILMVPALVYLLGLPQKLAQGISLAVILPVAVSGALIHLRKGNVIPNLAGWLSCGAVVGATVIGYRVREIEDATLRTLFGILLIAVGVSMVTGGRRPASDPM